MILIAYSIADVMLLIEVSHLFYGKKQQNVMYLLVNIQKKLWKITKINQLF